ARILDFNSESGEYHGESQYEVCSTKTAPVADGHGVITRKERGFHTMGYGVDDHLIMLGNLDSVEVSALQWVEWKTTKEADFLTVIGHEPNPYIPEAQAGIMAINDNPMIYTAVRGFQPGNIEKTGEQILNLGGDVYTTSAKLMTKKELQSNFPKFDFSNLTPTHAEELYCAALWSNVVYANGKRIHSGHWSVRTAEDSFVLTRKEQEIMKLPLEAHPMYRYYSMLNYYVLWHMTHLITLSMPPDYEYVDVRMCGKLAGTHIYFEHEFNGTITNSFINIIGIAGPDPRDVYREMAGFERGQIEFTRPSVVIDKLGKVITSHTEFLTKEQIQVSYPKADVSHLSSIGEFAVDHFKNVQMTEKVITLER
ncbi:MAG: hypothetical protein GY765_36210, partial [bacterium]|nr:hypothetical protein [bacterium]